MRILSVFLTLMVLIAGVLSCAEPIAEEPVQYNLTVSSSRGGSVITPGEDVFAYKEGTVVSLVAEAEEGYQFVTWSGAVDSVVDPDAAETTITMNDHYSITANFEELPPRMGAWVDEVVITQEPDPAQAVLKLSRDEIDVYASLIADPEVFEEIRVHPELKYAFGYTGMRELTFNPVGPEFPGTGKLNPFAVPKIREAMNWLIDRQHVVDEYMGGLGVPKWTALGTRFAEQMVHYPHIVSAIERYYAHDPHEATRVMSQEMDKLGAVLVDGKWQYQGEPVEIIIVIRSDLPPYPQAGHYIADLIEDLGFVVSRLVLPRIEAEAIWWEADPADGLFHAYTAGWALAAGFPRYQSSIFAQMYTRQVMPQPLWQALTPDPELDDVSRRIRFSEFTTMEEREELMETALWLAMEDSCRIWLADDVLASPFRQDTAIAADALAGIADPMWACSVHFQDDGKPVPGGTLRVAMAQVLAGPLNPVGGSTAAGDMFATRRALGDDGILPDTRDGLYWAQRIERAEVYVQEGLPMDITHDWLTLEFVSELVVPPDAWADWDAKEQRFVTVRERFPEGTTALRKSVVHYPADLYDVPLHDGSTLSIGDFVMAMIVRFDRAKEGSPIFDEAEVADFEAWLATFKGVRMTSTNPLIIETYSDAPVFYFSVTDTYESCWYLDAEWNVTTWFPTYGTYSDYLPRQPRDWTGFWHMITVGWLAEKNEESAFSASKAGALGVEWVDYTRGPSLTILKKWLDWAAAENYIPYAPTLGQYVSAAEAADRWANLQDWYDRKGHFWVGNGPFYLEGVYAEDKIVHLKRFKDHPDRADKWLFLLKPLP